MLLFKTIFMNIAKCYFSVRGEFLLTSERSERVDKKIRVLKRTLQYSWIVFFIDQNFYYNNKLFFIDQIDRAVALSPRIKKNWKNKTKTKKISERLYALYLLYPIKALFRGTVSQKLHNRFKQNLIHMLICIIHEDCENFNMIRQKTPEIQRLEVCKICQKSITFFVFFYSSNILPGQQKLVNRFYSLTPHFVRVWCFR